jgi:hypothetical protein
MDKTQTIIFAALAAFVAVRLYQKYIKKNNNKSASENKSSSDNSAPSASKDEDYEPYSKK